MTPASVLTMRPLLSGDDAAEAFRAVQAIAADLPAPDAAHDPGPASGSCGFALFWAAYAEATGDDAARATARAHVDAAVEAVATRNSVAPGLYSTPVGAGWALAVLEGRLLDVDPADNDVDVVVEKLLSMRPWPGSFDLVRGTAGLGVHALARLPRESAARSLALAVQRLRDTAVETGDGLAWPADLRGEVPERTAQFPDGYVDVGLAHGAPGVVAFLANALCAGHDAARPVLHGALAWLRAQRDPDAPPGHAFPSTVTPGGERRPARLAWCYGDPGVAVALLSAAHALDDADLLGEAREVARGCAARVEPLVRDAGLCHGSAGLGHVFARLGRGLGDPEVLDLAGWWMREALRARTPGEGVGGYLTYRPDDDRYEAEPGVLEGSAGIGLALLSALSAEEPWWDGLLLLDGCAG